MQRWGSWGAPKPCSRSHAFHRTAVPVLGDAAEPCSPGTRIVLWQPSAYPAGSLPEHGGHRCGCLHSSLTGGGSADSSVPAIEGRHSDQPRESHAAKGVSSAGRRWRGGRQFDWLSVPTDGVTAPGRGHRPSTPHGSHLSSSNVKSGQQYSPRKCHRQNNSTWRLEAVWHKVGHSATLSSNGYGETAIYQATLSTPT